MSYKGLVRPGPDTVKAGNRIVRKYGLYTDVDTALIERLGPRLYSLDEGFAPDNIPGLKIWLDAAVGTYQESTLTTVAAADDDPVGAWISMANGYAFIQATADSRLTLKTGANGINGLPVLRGDGTADHLKIASAMLNASSGTVIAVYQVPDETPAAGAALLSSDDEASGVRLWELYATSTTSRIAISQRNNDAVDSVVGDVGGIVADTPYIGVWESSDTAYLMRLNGTQQTIAVASGANNGDWTAQVANRDNTVLFARQTSAGVSNYMAGDIAELLVYEPQISTAARTAVEQYLAAKYGITLA